MALAKSKIISTLVESVRQYETHLNNKKFLFIYKVDGTFEFKEIEFNQNNFKHLTGVESNLSPKQFYSACLNNKLGQHQVEEKKDGTTALKLKILPTLHHLISMPTMIGDFQSYRIHLIADSALGSTNISLALADKKDVSVPKSLLKEDIRRLTRKSYPVVLVYSKNKKDEVYSTITYKSDKISATLMDEIKPLIGSLI